MKEKLLGYLACPNCGSELDFDPNEECRKLQELLSHNGRRRK